MNSSTKKILIFIITANIILATGYIVIFWQIRSQSQKSSELQNTLDSSEQKNTKLDSLEKVLNDTAADRATLASFFLNPDDEVTFIEKIEQLAKTNNLDITTTNVSAKNDSNSSFQALEFQAVTTGSFNNNLLFIALLENLPYNIRIEGADFSATDAAVPAQGNKSVASKIVWKDNLAFQLTESK